MLMKEMIKKYFDIKLLIIAILSATIQAIVITNFSIPANLYPGGFSGISRLTSDIFNDFLHIGLKYSYIYFSLNIIVIFFVFKNLGKKFAIYSLIQFSLVSLIANFMQPFIVLNEQLLYCVFGGIINGCAAGLALMFNFSTGGFDFISIYFSNKYKKSIWNYIFIANVCILTIAGIIYGWERSLYSIIFQYCSTEIVKKMHHRYTHTTLIIMTKEPDLVASEILKHVRHGITEIKAEGFYSHSDYTMLYSVVNQYQYSQIVKIVLNVDPKAFINVQNTKEIYGNYYQKPLE